MDDLRLTYIVPVYNTEAYVLRCLQSLVNQEIPEDNYEVIVIDDGSTDSSRDVVAAFACEHPQVRLITQANAGVSVARNVALDQARGRFIQFVDSDDYLELNMMAPLLNRAIALDVDVLVFNYQTVDADGHSTPHNSKSDMPSSMVMTGPEYLDCHVMSPYIWRLLISRDYIVQGEWRFNPSLCVCEDGLLVAQLMLHASRVAYDEALPYRYVCRDESAMHNQDIQHLRQRLFSQVDAASLIDRTIRQYEANSGKQSPASVAGLRNVYLFFAMTKALHCGLVDDVLNRIRQSGLYPFPCIGPESGYSEEKWRFVHSLMMRPKLWKFMSRICRLIK